MIVWGGFSAADGLLNTGGRYDPITDSWTPTASWPSQRSFPRAVWTGSEMIVWGGFGETNFLNNGGRYNPVTDSWTITSTTNAPIPRYNHTPVWTGTEMIIWGGYVGSPSNTTVTNTGGRYNPNTDSWVATTTTNAPSPRVFFFKQKTAYEMVVWG